MKKKEKEKSESVVENQDIPATDLKVNDANEKGDVSEPEDTSESELESGIEGVADAEPDPEAEAPVDFLKRWRERDPDSAVSSLNFLADVGPYTLQNESIGDSLGRIEGFREGGGYTLPEIETALAEILDLAADIREGIIPVEGLSAIIRASRFDSALEQARAEGVVEGRNALIEEKLRKEADDELASVPSLGGTSAGSGTFRPTSIFDIASQAR